MKKEEILRMIETYDPVTYKNSMCCSENWYNIYYALSKTFTQEELESMSEKELNNLIKLGESIQEGLY